MTFFTTVHIPGNQPEWFTDITNVEFPSYGLGTNKQLALSDLSAVINRCWFPNRFRLEASGTVAFWSRVLYPSQSVPEEPPEDGYYTGHIPWEIEADANSIGSERNAGEFVTPGQYEDYKIPTNLRWETFLGYTRDFTTDEGEEEPEPRFVGVIGVVEILLSMNWRPAERYLNNEGATVYPLTVEALINPFLEATAPYTSGDVQLGQGDVKSFTSLFDPLTPIDSIAHLIVNTGFSTETLELRNFFTFEPPRGLLTVPVFNLTAITFHGVPADL